MEIRISVTKTILTNSKYYTLYIVEINFKDWNRVLEKRYSEFLELHRDLKSLKTVLGFHLPKFPSKHVWKTISHNFTANDIETRRTQLQEYFIKLKDVELACTSRRFMDFLDMPNELREQWIQNYL